MIPPPRRLRKRAVRWRAVSTHAQPGGAAPARTATTAPLGPAPRGSANVVRQEPERTPTVRRFGFAPRVVKVTTTVVACLLAEPETVTRRPRVRSLAIRSRVSAERCCCGAVAGVLAGGVAGGASGSGGRAGGVAGSRTSGAGASLKTLSFTGIGTGVACGCADGGVTTTTGLATPAMTSEYAHALALPATSVARARNRYVRRASTVSPVAAGIHVPPSTLTSVDDEATPDVGSEIATSGASIDPSSRVVPPEATDTTGAVQSTLMATGADSVIARSTSNA